MDATLDGGPVAGGITERALVRVGVRDDVARLLASTPALRLSWLGAATIAAGFSAWAASANEQGLLVFLVVAPALPVAGVAAAYGPWADPVHEVATATPFSGLRLVLVRATAVLVATTVITAVAGAVVPSGDVSAFAWVLPALALTVASLALGTFVMPHAAAAIVTALWLGTVVMIEMRETEPFSAFRGPGQIAFAAIVIACTGVLAWRRDQLQRRGRARSRQLIDVAETERRRIERDLHDGAQQHLVAIGVKLGLVEALITKDPDRARTALTDIRSDVQLALDALRDLTRGSYPPVLADHGLGDALVQRGRGMTVPVVVDADGIGRFARDVETAVYFCCLEAMQNASKYASAAQVLVVLRRAGGQLAFDVIDDGRGFEPSIVQRGVGLRSLEERLGALGGVLEVRSSPGRGTTIAGRIPLAAVGER